MPDTKTLEQRFEEIEKRLDEAEKDIEMINSNLLTLNSSFSGLNISYKFIHETLNDIKKQVERRNKEAKKVESHFLHQLADFGNKLDELMEKIEHGQRNDTAGDKQAQSDD